MLQKGEMQKDLIYVHKQTALIQIAIVTVN